MRQFLITVDANGKVTTDTKQLGYSGEHNAATLVFNFTDDAEEVFSQVHYFRVVIDGHYSTDILRSEDGVVYKVPQECMCPPRAQCQLVGYIVENDEPKAIVKSEVFGFDIDRSEVPFDVADTRPSVLEQAMEICRSSSKSASEDARAATLAAKSASEDAKAATLAANSAMVDANNAQNYCKEAKQASETSKKYVEVLAQKTIDLETISNALKGSASGKVVVIKDVSPLEHTVKVKLDGDNIGGEVLTKTERLDTKYQDVMLNNASKSVRVVMFGDSCCVGGAIPLVDGQDLTQLNDFSNFAIVPVGHYAEVGGIRDITYKIEGNTLKWEGFGGAWYQDEIYERFDISGEYTLSSSGQNIIGFCEAYGLDEDNPNYMASEYDNLRIDISIYEGNAATVKVFGKNYFDISKVVTLNSAGYDYKVINNGDGTITVTTATQTSTSAKAPNTLKDYAPDLKVGETYCLSAYSTPVEGTPYPNNYIYLSGTGANVTWMFNDADKGKLKITEDLLNAKVLWYTWGKTNATTTISNIQIEKGKTATEYEPYIEPTEYTTDANGEAKIPSMCPTMTIIPDTDVELSVEYNRDINKAFAELQAAIISMGGNV